MPAFIHDIATAVPPASSPQTHTREFMKNLLGNDRRTRAIIHRIYQQSAIAKRHSVLHDFSPDSDGQLFFRDDDDGVPGTGERNSLYETEARKLFVDVAADLLRRNPRFPPESISHVITVSCTGFFAPGPEYAIVNALKLRVDTQRYHLGFMGCCAALPALRLARTFCEADPRAVVLVVCTELCTLHFQQSDDLDSILSASLFADGAAGALISANAPDDRGLEMKHFDSTLAPDSEADMAWTIGDTGFQMVLSMRVPEIIQRNVKSVIQPLYDTLELDGNDIDYWAVHPGGRAILDSVETGLSLDAFRLEASRAVLRDFGNMSSATILFVLKEILESRGKDRQTKDRQKVLAMAFGPGLTIESALFIFCETLPEEAGPHTPV